MEKRFTAKQVCFIVIGILAIIVVFGKVIPDATHSEKEQQIKESDLAKELNEPANEFEESSLYSMY